ncbi:MAG: carboxy terminal-processing peptidase [Bacteroidia bacterium]
MRKFTRNIFFALLITVFTSFAVKHYLFDKNDVIMEIILGGLNQSHYSPLKLDDKFSEKVFDLYLKRLDLNKKFLYKSDVDELLQHRTMIDDEIANQNHRLFRVSSEIIEKRIKEKENWYKEYLSKPLDYNADEYYETNPDKVEFAKSEKELRKEWEKMLKYQVLIRLDELLTLQDEAKAKNDTAFQYKSYDSLEVEARRRTIKANDNLFKYYNKFTSKDRFNVYANAITGIYDPHTEYFAPREKKKFDQVMSGQFEGIGARLQSRDGQLKVTEIIVGSPCFKQGDLKAGDEIIKVAQGKEEPVDVTNMDIDDAIELIKGKKGTEVRLTVKRPDGSKKVIPIIRDVVEMDETFAKSVLLKNKSDVGYIYLPSFYTDFTRSGAHKCATDVRHEILKLKELGVKSLILDLRNNGGGSLQEVVEMAGLFFKKGPVVQIKDKSENVRIMEDYDPSVIWEGPLAIMVNHGSASASEILAAAMQDYKRGIIVGTNTFGKGTVQSFLNLDYYLLPQFDSIKPIGQVKVTQQKFYRINGGSTQLKGVSPDISFPDPYSMIELGERQLDNPMPWDEINKASYAEFGNIPYAKLLKKSQERMKKSEQFKAISDRAKDVKKRKDDTKYSLKLDKFREDQKYYRELNKEYTEHTKIIPGFETSMLDKDIQRLKADTTRLNREKRWAENLAKDVYVYETTNILNEMN